MIINLAPKPGSMSLRALKQTQHKLREAISMFDKKRDCSRQAGAAGRVVVLTPRNDIILFSFDIY
jgi:hypothetical protein